MNCKHFNDCISRRSYSRWRCTTSRNHTRVKRDSSKMNPSNGLLPRADYRRDSQHDCAPTSPERRQRTARSRRSNLGQTRPGKSKEDRRVERHADLDRNHERSDSAVVHSWLDSRSCRREVAGVAASGCRLKRCISYCCIFDIFLLSSTLSISKCRHIFKNYQIN